MKLKFFKSFLLTAASMPVFGLGQYMMIQANLGTDPWVALNIGFSKSVGIQYGVVAFITSSFFLLLDICIREPIGLNMLIDAMFTGKVTGLFINSELIPLQEEIIPGIILLIIGMFLMGFSQFLFMSAAMGCGPRDALLVGLSRRFPKIPIGLISVAILTVAIILAVLLKGPIGTGTIICVCFTGPIMNLIFRLLLFDATEVKHKNIYETIVDITKGVVR